jgi:hypothetical protein
MDYSDQYRHPQWQKRRLERLEKSGFSCENCGDGESQLHVHHIRYTKGSKVWEYDDNELEVLCEVCHSALHEGRDTFGLLLTMQADPAAFEGMIHGIAEGLSLQRNDGPRGAVQSLDEIIGYAAGYLHNIDSDILLAMTSIAPDTLAAFIKEQSQ